MIDFKNDSITVGWIDNGMNDGGFTEGVIGSVMTMLKAGINVENILRCGGNQIARQRQIVLDNWYDNYESDWLLWIDTDVLITHDKVEILLNSADKDTAPIVTGLYFITNQNEETLMRPLPCIYTDVSEYKIQHIHPLPINKMMQIDLAGMGFLIMHRSVITKMREVYKDTPLFEEGGVGTKFIGEDIAFFRKMKNAGVPLYVHTAAHVQHMKRFSFDLNYYLMYWENSDKINVLP
jgi:hypothetical protein